MFCHVISSAHYKTERKLFLLAYQLALCGGAAAATLFKAESEGKTKRDDGISAAVVPDFLRSFLRFYGERSERRIFTPAAAAEAHKSEEAVIWQRRLQSFFLKKKARRPNRIFAPALQRSRSNFFLVPKWNKSKAECTLRERECERKSDE